MCRLYSHQRISFKITKSYINVFHNENMISRLTWQSCRIFRSDTVNKPDPISFSFIFLVGISKIRV